VADLMIGSFFYVAMDQVANQAAKLPYMSGGQIQLPMVLFAASGPSGAAAAQHSENPHPMMMNVAGLKIVMPGTPADAKGLMYAAVREPSPVLFFHDAALSGMKGPVPEGQYEVPLGVADVKRQGDDVTIVAIGGLVRHALKAAEQLAEEGISAEVVDPRSLVPLDEDAILRSVAKTGRLVVCDNARRTCSAASEIAAMVAERGWDTLQAPPRRVAWENTPVPFSPVLEKRVLVDAGKIADAVRATVGTAPVAA
jgi:pyruvate dehydrogenase E1 component beta subunit